MTELDFTASPPSLSSPLPPKLTVTTEQGSETDPENQKGPLAGLPFTYPQISSLSSRAKAKMPLRPVRFPILESTKSAFPERNSSVGCWTTPTTHEEGMPSLVSTSGSGPRAVGEVTRLGRTTCLPSSQRCWII